ncbi:MAG: tautomerase family protein [Gammaproteobacteria bacterium]|nr:tautomerase family protein [Gammaproteobacteria bacterium]
MAIVNLTIFEGRDRDTKARLIQALTDAVVQNLPARPEHVRVVLHEVPEGSYGVAGKIVTNPAGGEQ